jgi:Holliday junction resolvase
LSIANKSKAKGSRAELDLRNLLRKHTGLAWERTPLSGALDKVHCLSGDLYIPRENNKYTVEVKHYKDSAINHLLLCSDTPILKTWWAQCQREAKENKNLPLLIFKHDRSKWFVATNVLNDKDNYSKILIDRDDLVLEISLLEEWLVATKPEFVIKNYMV